MINTTDLETTDKMIPIHVGNGSAEDLDLFNDCCIPFIALRWPTARSKTHSSLPSGVVPCGTVQAHHGQ